MAFPRTELIATAAVPFVGAILSACGADSTGNGGGNGDWYYHWNCNGDQQCLATHPSGMPTGTLDEGPVQVNCTQLLTFALHFWGSAATTSCDQSPTGGGGTGGGGTGGATAAQLVLTTSAAGAHNGAAFTTQPVVAARDANGNTITSHNSTFVTMTVSTGRPVVGTATATASGGVATFVTVGISGTVGTVYSLTFRHPGLTSATQNITPAAGAASQLALVTSAAGAPSGAAFTTQPVVAVRDAGGNTVTTDNSSVVTMTACAGVTIVGSATATAVNGVATFTSVGISGHINLIYTLTFATGTLTVATQIISPSLGAANQLVLTTNAGGALSGVAFPRSRSSRCVTRVATPRRSTTAPSSR